jgi:flagellar motor switch protein FliM
MAGVSLASGTRTGNVLLALPAGGKARKTADPVPAASAGGLVFKAAMSEQILTTNATLNAVVARVTLPLQAILNFRQGDPLLLGQAVLDQIDIEGVDGCRVAGGKLGQNKGMRAIRLSEKTAPAARHSLKIHKPADELPRRAAG